MDEKILECRARVTVCNNGMGGRGFCHRHVLLVLLGVKSDTPILKIEDVNRGINKNLGRTDRQTNRQTEQTEQTDRCYKHMLSSEYYFQHARDRLQIT